MIKVLLILLPFLLSDADLDKQVNSYLAENFSNYIRYEYEIMDLPSSFENIEISKDRGCTLQKDIVHIPVRVTNNTNETFDSHLNVKIKLYQFVLVAVNDIERNTDLSSDQFRVEILDVAELRGEPLPVHELDNKRNHRFVRKGSPLLTEMVEEKPVIEPGDVVWLNSSMGSVNIKMSVISRQEGSVNEIIRVKSEDNKLFRAKVLDSKNVLVME